MHGLYAPTGSRLEYEIIRAEMMMTISEVMIFIDILFPQKNLAIIWNGCYRSYYQKGL